MTDGNEKETNYKAKFPHVDFHLAFKSSLLCNNTSNSMRIVISIRKAFKLKLILCKPSVSIEVSWFRKNTDTTEFLGNFSESVPTRELIKDAGEQVCEIENEFLMNGMIFSFHPFFI